MTTMQRPKSERLMRRYRELREAGATPMRRREAYNAWFRQCCKEGRSPSSLREHSADEAERFWARTVAGPDGHVYWTSGRLFRKNDGKSTRPQRWAWSAAGRDLNAYIEIENTCGEGNCVNPEHMQVRPRAATRVRFSDERAIAALQVLKMRLGFTPSRRDWDAADLPVTASAMNNRFRNWGAFCRAAGLEPQRPSHALQPETCVRAVVELAAEIGRPPTARDWEEHHGWLKARGFPTSPTSIRNKLGGSFTSAVAGVLSSGGNVRRAA
jgi:hypothetical protein